MLKLRHHKVEVSTLLLVRRPSCWWGPILLHPALPSPENTRPSRTQATTVVATGLKIHQAWYFAALLNLSRMPGLDLCCDLLQHLQGVPCTFSFYIIIYTYIDFARPITQIVFHVKCNQIQFSCYMDGIFCSILFHSV